ncbi:hypothetical protein FCL40_13400 [Ferrimonas sediminicola]|uniref:Uncharacterized protein n=1 Tax=Ferrimonas sediminicola TaxID=2569538 RepID=A0A4U1BBP2_9GAMM|nr:hypothetical protein [Ferrimonas sediminicola]TKB48340.1 hypothetical protein FCL40_13400 [Ferrimonas sediminicola]
MSLYDSNQVAALLRQMGQADELLAEAYVYGSVSGDGDNDGQLKSLQKAKLLRPDDEPGSYRLTADVKRLLNKLMRQQSGYRQLTDMGKVIDAMDDVIIDYRDSLIAGQMDDADHYLDQLDDLLFDARDSLNTSLDNMHYAISSQFGFVATLTAKVRENQKALDYAQKLLNELQQIDPETCYQWIFDGAPTEFARKITGFVHWFRNMLGRLAHVIEKMRQSLFRLRRQVKQANQLRGMARFLRKHPEYELREDLPFAPELPRELKLVPAMVTGGLVDVRSSAIEQDLVEIVQHLRRQAPSEPLVGDREAVSVESDELEVLAYLSDWVLDEVEHFFEQAVLADQGLSALGHWQAQQGAWLKESREIDPQLWIELVFGYYCKLAPQQQSIIALEMEEQLVPGTNNNFTYSDVTIKVA